MGSLLFLPPHSPLLLETVYKKYSMDIVVHVVAPSIPSRSPGYSTTLEDCANEKKTYKWCLLFMTYYTIIFVGSDDKASGFVVN